MRLRLQSAQTEHDILGCSHERNASPANRFNPRTTLTVTVQPSSLDIAQPAASTRSCKQRRVALWRRIRVLGLQAATIFLALQVLGASGYSWRALVVLDLNQATKGERFNLLNWEIGALREKAGALWARPAAGLSARAGSDLVRAYIEDARLLARLESQAAALRAEGTRAADQKLGFVLAKADRLRAHQAERRPAAEAVVEAQITQMLKQAGFGLGGRVMPPVLFTFTESPKQLVVSPRTRIISGFTRTLDSAMSFVEKEQTEADVEANGLWSAFVTETGGMGAFPTMVVADARLEWVLSTVAHEWVHTYLAFFPLGFNYGITAENRIINETAADIVGDEIGRRTLALFYPEVLPPPARDDVPHTTSVHDDTAAFDFNSAMAETRAVADTLLHFGRVADAEQYMELRRQYFVENGFRLRKLNQAWFAFHGSYGTSAAAAISTPDALAPKVIALRAATGDAHAFLKRIRGITDVAGLDRLLVEIAPPQPER